MNSFQFYCHKVMGKKNCCVCDGNNIEWPQKTFFRVPSKEKLGDLFEIWKNFIGEAYYTDKNEIYICESHFELNQIVAGKSRKLLVVGAIPSLKDESDRNLDKIFEQYASPSFKPRSKVIDFNDIVSECEILVQIHSNLTLKMLNEGVLIYLLNLEPPFNSLYQIFINKDKNVKIFSGHGALEMIHFKNYFAKPYVLASISELRNLILNLSTNIGDNSDPDFVNIRKKFKCTDLINFFENQLRLSTASPTNRRYGTDLIIFAYSLYIKSPSLYSDLVKFFYLPSIRLLRRYTQPMNKSLKDDDSNYYFLQQQYQALKPHERLVTLKFDEIQIKPKLEYRSGELAGFAANTDGETAKHVQAFMIQSVLSKYSEVVQLIPVTRNNTSFLIKLFLEVVANLEDIGFEILCATSDNNAINRLLFDKLCVEGTTYIISGNQKKIFTMFDAPHMIKSFRNNFINSTPDKVFMFPPLSDYFNVGSDIVSTNSLESDKEFEIAKWQHLVDLYYHEQNKLFKYGHNLSSAAMFPTPITRQKVSLALCILNEKIPAALNVFNKEAGATANLLRIFKKFWDIFNINNTTKSLHKKNPDCAPFTDLKLDLDRNRIDWLNNMVRFLGAWESCHKVYGILKLSSPTFHSLKYSCRSLIGILNHIFYERNFKFFLTVKLQTDCLEGRFGIYRQTNGGSYHITLNQVIAAEKKLRAINCLKLGSNFLEEKNLVEYNHGFNEFFAKIDIDIPFILYQDVDTDFGTLIYISGYIIAEVYQHIKCNKCAKSLEFDADIDNEYGLYNYIDSINRGGLKIPSNNFVHLLYRCQIIFEEYILPKMSSEIDNLNRENLVRLFMKFLWESELNDFFDFCNHHSEKCFKLIFKIFSNFIFNNITKIVNDEIESSKIKSNKISKHDGVVQSQKFF